MKEQDADFILELLSDPSFIRNIVDRKVRTLEGAKGYITDGTVLARRGSTVFHPARPLQRCHCFF